MVHGSRLMDHQGSRLNAHGWVGRPNHDDDDAHPIHLVALLAGGLDHVVPQVRRSERSVDQRFFAS